jgi:Flp pilus assembly pilin Flp
VNRPTPRKRTLRELARATDGLSTVEYIILLVLVAIVGIAAWSAFGSKIREKITGSTGRIDRDLGDPSSR